jgi:hypothetical protein
VLIVVTLPNSRAAADASAPGKVNVTMSRRQPCPIRANPSQLSDADRECVKSGALGMVEKLKTAHKAQADKNRIN